MIVIRPKKFLILKSPDYVSMKSLFKGMEPVFDHRIKKSVDSKTLSCRWVMQWYLGLLSIAIEIPISQSGMLSLSILFWVPGS